MIKSVTARQMGGSVGATLPREMVDRLRIRPGDRIFAIETESGILLTPYDPDFAEAMEAYDQFGRRYRNALKLLGDG